MKKLLQMKFMLLLCALIVGSGTMWADDELYYTLDGTITTGGNSNYAQDGGGLTQGEIDWSVTGNTTINPWRIGGKNLTDQNREAYSKTAMGSAITKVELEIGSITLTVNSIKFIVASDADFGTILDEQTISTVTANQTYTFVPTSGSEWATGAFYKFVFNVTAGSSNSYIQLKSAKFYKAGASTGPSISANDAAVSWDAEGGNIEYTISNPVEGGFVMATEWDTEATWLQFSGNGSGNKLPFTVSTNYGGERSANVTLKYTYVIDEKVYDASTTVTVTQGAKPAPVIIVDQDSYTIGKDQTSIEIPYTIQYPNPNTNPALAFEGNTEWTTLGRVFDYDNNKVTITTDANNTPERTVNVVFKYDGAADKTVTLTQEGVIWPTVSFRANPAEGASVLNCTSNSNQLTSGSMVEPGSWVTLYVGLADNYEFDSWTDANDKLDFSNTTTTPGTDPKSVTLVFQMPEDDVEIVANLKSNLSEEWVETTLANLTANDVFVIVGDNGNTYAMANDSGTSDAPSAVAVTVDNGKLTGSVADNIQWNISGNATDGYTFYPNGDTETWLYCTNSNNGVRVGANTSKTFVIDQNYLKHIGTSRYVGIYNSQDWRCYTSINANIKDQTFAFYKKVSTAPDERAEAGLAFNESSYSVELVNAASFTSPVLSNPNELSPITWTSSNETVATVNEGTVTILSEGETTIKAKFEGNDDYKPGEASYTLSVVDNRQTATVTWKDADGNNITELNVEKGDFIQGITLSCNVEGFTFTEKHLQHLWGTNETHDNYYGQQPAGYIFTPNAVWTAALGITTITATFPGNETHKPASATLTVNVTGGTETTPYTVAEAIAATPASGTTDKVYIKGIVSKFYNTSIVGDGSNYRYYISDDGTTTNQLIVYRGKGLNEQTFSSADDLQIGDKVVIYGGLTMYNNASEVASGNYIVSLVRKPAAPTFSPAAGTYTSTKYVTISAADGAAIYYTTDGTDPTTESTQYSGTITVNESMTIKAIAVKDSEISDVATAVYVIDLTPSIVFDGEQNPANVTYTAGETNIHYVASNVADLPTIVICDNEGNQASYDWFSAEVTSDVYVHVTWQANTDTENSRTAYFKLISGATESEIFEFTQAKYVPDYAELPFEFNDGRADIEETDGLTQEGLGDDYKASTNPTTKLKFDTTGDWMILKINEIPGTLTFDIKGNSFSGGTFKVQTSADGETFTDLASYTSIGSDTETKEFDDLADNVRYIKWVYTEKVSGNVGLGNINLAKPITDPVIKLAETSVEVDAKQHDGTIALTYKNLQIDSMDDFDVQFYSDEQGTVTADAPEWVEALVAEQDPSVGPGYVLSYVINANDGAARTAYLRVYADDGVNSVASDVVTITQAKFVKTTTYTLAHSITPGKHYVIASGNVGTVYVMGKQKSTNRDAVYGAEVNFNEVLSVTEDIAADVREFIISKDGNYYTIFDFDENESGYLYASSTSDNHLKTQATNNANGQWTITIDEEGIATLKANMTGRNWMRFNNGSSKVFSCYGEDSNQQDIYLFEKDNDEGSLVIPIAAACTDGTKCYATFSSTKPFVVPENLTVSEIGIDTDGTMNVVNYDAGAVVPANTGVMVSAAVGDRSYVANVSTEVGNNVLNGDNRLRPTGDNDLAATEMNSAEPETCKFYRLTMHGAAENNPGKIGFWWGADGGDSFAIAANKAYLAVPASVAGTRNGFAFGDDATGINNVNVNENMNGSVFDLQGRKVSTPGKGLYIVNGKKVVIK